MESGSSPTMIEAVDLEKSFGAVGAVRGVTFSVRQGEVLGFLGPNGAGKTTTFRMLAGTLSPTQGRVAICGYDIASQPLQAKSRLGYMPENALLYPELSAREYLSYRAELKHITRSERDRAILRASEQAKIGTMLDTRIAHLSKGYRGRVALADALLGSPPVLLLDEPTAGLDPNQVLEVRALIASLREEHAILISTHVLSEVEATCTSALVIHKGKVVEQGPLDALRQRQKGARLKLVVQATVSSLGSTLGPLLARLSPRDAAKVRIFQREGQSHALLPSADESLVAEAVRLCVAAGLAVLEVTPQRRALDDVFAALTTSQATDEVTASIEAQ